MADAVNSTTQLSAEVRRLGAPGGRIDGVRVPPLRGFLPALPRVGFPMILYSAGSDRRVASLITSLVERVLMDPNGRDLFVETQQSVYRVTLDGSVVQLPPASACRVSFDGFELTIQPTAPNVDPADEAEKTD